MSYDYNASRYPVQSATWDSSSQASSVYSPTAYNQMWPGTPTGHVALASPNASLYSAYSTATYTPGGYIYAYPNGQYSGASGYYGAQPSYGQAEGSKQKPAKDTGSKNGTPSSAAAYSSNSHQPVSYGAYGGQTQTNTQLHDYDTLLSYYGYCKPNSSSQGGGGYKGHSSSYAAKPKGAGAAHQSGASTSTTDTSGASTATTNQSGAITGTTNQSGTSTGIVTQKGSSTGAVDSNLTQQFAGKCKLASPDAKARRAEVSTSWSAGDKGEGYGKPQSDVHANQSTTCNYTESSYDHYGGKGETAKSWPSSTPQSRYDSSGTYGHSTPDNLSSYNSSRTQGSYGSSMQEAPSSYNTSSGYSQPSQETPSSFNSSQVAYSNLTQGTTAKVQSNFTQQSVGPYTSSTTQSNYAHSKQQATVYSSSSAQSNYSHSSQQGSYSSAGASSSYTQQQSTGSYSSAGASISYTQQQSTGSYSSAGASSSYTQQQSTGSYTSAGASSSYTQQQSTGSYNSSNTSTSYSISTSISSPYEYSQQDPGSGSNRNTYGKKPTDPYSNNNITSGTGSVWGSNKNDLHGANQNATKSTHSGGDYSKQPAKVGGSASSETGYDPVSSNDNGLSAQYEASESQKQGIEDQSVEDKGDISAEAVDPTEDKTGIVDGTECPAEETVPMKSEPMTLQMEEAPISKEEREYMFPVSSGLYHKATVVGTPGRPFNREEDLGNCYNDGANFYTMGHMHGYGQLHWNTGRQAWARKDQFTKAPPIRGGFGMKMLTRMGWKPGEGLGKERTGGFEPLAIKVKIDRKGLSAEEELTAKGKIKRPVPELNINIDPKKTKNVPVAPKVFSEEEELKLREMVTHRHPVMALNEVCGKKQWPLPTYKNVFKNYGVCMATVNVNGTSYEATHPNKKLAKAEVARIALQGLGYAPMALNCCFTKKSFL